MGRPIKRSTLDAIASEYEAKNQVGTPPTQGEPQEINPGAIFYGVNWGDDPIMPGDRLFLLGFHNAIISYKYAYRRLLNNKIKLSVNKWKETNPEPTDSKVIFQAITPATHNHICKFKCTPSEVFFANVYGPPDGESPRRYQYITINGVGTDDKDEAFAYWGPCSLASDPDQQGGRYYVALCAKIQQEELTGDAVMATLNVNSASTVTNVTETTGTVNIPTAASVTITPTGNVALALGDTQTTGAIEVVTDIAAVNGALGVEKKYVSASYTGTQQTVSASLTTSSQSVVTGISKTTANRVSSVTAKANNS